MIEDNQLRLDLKANTEVKINGDHLVYRKALSHGDLLFETAKTGETFRVEDAVTGEFRLPDVDWLDHMRADGKFCICVEPGKRKNGAPAPAFDIDLDPIGQSKSMKNRRCKLAWLLKLDAAAPRPKLTDAALGNWIAVVKSDPDVAEHDPPSGSALRKWSKKYGTPGDRRISDIMELRGRVSRGSRLSFEEDQLLNRIARFYYENPTWDQGDAYSTLCTLIYWINDRRKGFRKVGAGKSETFLRRTSVSTGPQLKIPSKETLRLRILAFECFDYAVKRWGHRVAHARFKSNGIGLYASAPLELAVLDHTKWDTFVVVTADRKRLVGRPWICLIIDVCTRCILGWYITFFEPNHHSAITAVIHANRPKVAAQNRHPAYPGIKDIYGTVNELVVDNGLEVSSGSFREAMLDHGTNIRFCPIKAPQNKAIGEVIFSTLKLAIARKMKGRVPASIDVRADMEIDPEKDAVVTKEELELIIEEGIAKYHFEEHSTIEMQPIRALMKSAVSHALPTLPDERRLIQMTGRTVNNAMLTASGIRLNNLQYHDFALTEHLRSRLRHAGDKRGTRDKMPNKNAGIAVKVKYNPEDLGAIDVFNHADNSYVTLPCTKAEYVGLSLFEAKLLRRINDDENKAFVSERQFHENRSNFRKLLDNPSRAVGRRNQVRLQEKEDARRSTEDIAFQTAEPRHDGMANARVAADALMGTRNDNGNPAPNKRRGARKTKSGATEEPPALQQRTSCWYSKVINDDSAWGIL